MNEIEKLKECIVEQLLPVQIYLFGSYANNTFTNESDLDFILLLKMMWQIFLQRRRKPIKQSGE